MHSCHLVKDCSITNRLKASVSIWWDTTAAKFNQWFLLVAKQGQCCFFYLISLLFIAKAPVEWHLQIACHRCMSYLTPLKVSETWPTDRAFSREAVWQAEILWPSFFHFCKTSQGALLVPVQIFAFAQKHIKLKGCSGWMWFKKDNIS